jgi:hypothetical protein
VAGAAGAALAAMGAVSVAPGALSAAAGAVSVAAGAAAWSAAAAAVFLAAAAVERAFCAGGAVPGHLLGGGGHLLGGAGHRSRGLLRRRRLLRGAGAGAARTRVARTELGGELVGELAEQLVADVGHDAAAELGRPAGDVEVGQDVDPRGGALGFSWAVMRACAVPLPRWSLPRAVDDRLVRGLVLLDEGGLALVGQVDRAELDLDPAGEVVAGDRVRAAPGMHGAIRSMSSSTRQASSMGTGTVNEFSNCTVLPPGERGLGRSAPGRGRAGRCVRAGSGGRWIDATAPPRRSPPGE